MIFIWLSFILGGFLLGSVLFSKIIPMVFLHKNICKLGADHNPGAANVFMTCGVRIGGVCLALDMLKGFLPVFLASFFVDTDSMWFALVIAAPVLGHAIGIFNRFHGGKCISTSFGVVLGLMPVSMIGFLLAELYVLFSTLIRLRPHSLRSIVTYALFLVGESIIMCVYGKYSVAIGCAVLSLAAIVKHLGFFNRKQAEGLDSGEAAKEKLCTTQN